MAISKSRLSWATVSGDLRRACRMASRIRGISIVASRPCMSLKKARLRKLKSELSRAISPMSNRQGMGLPSSGEVSPAKPKGAWINGRTLLTVPSSTDWKIFVNFRSIARSFRPIYTRVNGSWPNSSASPTASEVSIKIPTPHWPAAHSRAVSTSRTVRTIGRRISSAPASTA